jgi:N-acyl-D-amino-acid deacylase
MQALLCLGSLLLLWLVDSAAQTSDFPKNIGPLDLVIRGATVIDGTGGAGYAADVGVKDGKIVFVGTCATVAVDEIHAPGLALAPGFIDVHTHAESEVKGAVGGDDILSIPEAENFVRMGVTTIVTGNCGLSSSDTKAFLAAVDAARPAVNVAALIGHNTVREKAMGGILRRPPSVGEMERMLALVETAMQDGAVGMSTGLIYVPGAFSKTEELVALAGCVARYGGIYASHMRFETTRIFEAVDEVLRVAREAQIPVQISHLKLSGPSAWGRAREVLSKLDTARAEGLRVTHDCYAYTYSSTGLAQLLPDAAREGGRSAFIERIADPVRRAAIIEEMAAMRQRWGRTDYAYATIARYDAEPSLQGKTVPEAAAKVFGSDSINAQIRLLFDVESKGGGSGVFQNMSAEDMRVFLAHPFSMFASDGSPRRLGEAMPHPRSFGNNARILARHVRGDELLQLEEAIRKMTSLPADTFRLGQRGRIRVGEIADLVLFDPAAVTDRSEVGDPHHFSEGFHSVLVRGIPVLRAGKLTGNRSGRALRLRRSEEGPISVGN